MVIGAQNSPLPTATGCAAKAHPSPRQARPGRPIRITPSTPDPDRKSKPMKTVPVILLRSEMKVYRTMSAHIAVVLAVCLSIMLLASCGRTRGSRSARHLARTVADAEIVGTWQMTAASTNLLLRDGYPRRPSSALTIRFKSDGSLAFASAEPGYPFGPRTYTDATGHWKLSHHTFDGFGKGEPNVLSIDIERLASAGGKLFWPMYLTDVGGQLRLWYPHGDPDSREYIEYERAQEEDEKTSQKKSLLDAEKKKGVS